MNHRRNGMIRPIAALLALVLLLGSAQPAALLQVVALGAEGGIPAGKPVALTYEELTDAEKALLSSGLFPGDSIVFTAPDSGSALVEVDTDNHFLSAESYDDGEYLWEPVYADLVDDAGNVIETLDMSDGYAEFATDSRNFTAKVTYEMVSWMDTDDQYDQLLALESLYISRKNADAVYSTDADLGVIVLAMDSLNMLANGMSISFPGGGSITAKMGVDGAAAVRALRKQAETNGGLLDLQVMNQAYASGSRSEYLVTSGQDYFTKAVVTYGYIKAIAEDPIMQNSMVDSYIKNNKPEMAKAWSTVKSRLSAITSALEAATGEWPILNLDTFRDDLTGEDYRLADELLIPVLKQESLTDVHAIDLTEDVVADRTVISVSAGMVLVQLSVVVDTFGENNTPEEVTASGEQKLPHGSTREQVEQAFASVLEEAKAKLNALGCDLSGYERSVETDMEETLGDAAEVSYVIRFTPRNYSITDVNGQTASYPYGYGLLLETSGVSTMVYDYYINGEYYPQGSIYQVKGDAVITRQEGRPYTYTSLMKLLAEHFATEKEAAILTSGALKGDRTISVRYPDTESGAVTLEEGVLTAEALPANNAGLMWVPYSYTILDQTYFFDGKTVVEVPVGGFDTIQVHYRLTLTDISPEEANRILEAVRAMAEDAAGQKQAMDMLNAQYSSMGNLSKSMLNILRSMIRDTQLNPDPVKNSELREEFVEIITQIMENCIDTDNKLKIYNLLTGYRGENGGMAYYLKNSATIIREVQLLSGYLSRMMDSDDKVEALRVLVSEMGKPEYADKLLDLQKIVTQVSNDLTPTHSMIDTESRNLDVLAKALTMEGQLGSSVVSDSLWLESNPFVVEAPDKAVVKVTITAGGRVLDTLVNTFELGYVLTQQDMDAIRAQVEAVVNEKIQSRYYSMQVDVELDSLVGTELRRTVSVNYHYEPYIFTVHIEGEKSQTISLEDMSVALPKAPTGFRYDYTVDGAIVGAGTYRFTTDQLDRLFTGGSYTIRRTMVDVTIENMNTFLADLNRAGEGTLVFTINDNWDTITATANAESRGQLYAAITRVAEVMLNSPYDYIGLNDKGMLYTNEEGDTKISLQTLIDTIVGDNSFGSRKLISLQNGGNLANTTLQLGDSPEALEQNVAFVINVESTTGDIAAAGATLERIEDMLTFQSRDGVLYVDMGLTEDTYRTLLTMLLLSGNADKNNLNQLKSPAALKMLFTILQQLSENPAITTTTLINTGDRLGTSFAFGEHEEYYRYLTGIVGDSVFTYTDQACLGEMRIDLKSIMAEAVTEPEKVALLGMIQEYETGLMINMSFHLNAQHDWQAAIVDLAGGEIRYSKDLIADLASITGESLILLQSDIPSDLTLPDGTTLDLGGHSIDGDVIAMGRLTIIDSAASTYGSHVSGKIVGNVLILGGSYSENVSHLLGKGLIQDKNQVRHPGFTVETDENGNITYTIHTDAAAGDHIPGELVYDLLVRYMTLSGLAWEDSAVLQAEGYELFALLQSGNADGKLFGNTAGGVNTESLSKLLSRMLTDLADYKDLAKAIASGEALASYQLALTPFDIRTEHMAEEDYLNFHLTPGQDSRNITVTIRADGTGMGAAAEAIGDVVTTSKVTATVHQLIFQEDTGRLTLSLGKEQRLTMICGENGDYAILLAVILAKYEPALSSRVAAAINAQDDQSLKAILDGAALETLRAALMSYGGEDFASVATAMGITADLTSAIALENALHDRLVRAGETLKNLTLSDGSKTFGSFENAAEAGKYTFTEAGLVSTEDQNMGALSVSSTMTTEKFVLTIQLFDGKAVEVYDAQGKLLLETDSLEEAVAAASAGGKICLRKMAVQKQDITLSTSVNIEGVKNLKQGSFRFLLAKGGAVVADGKLNVLSAAEGWYADYSSRETSHSYWLSPVPTPTFSGDMADLWKVNGSKETYLCVDIDPTKGMTPAQLQQTLQFAKLGSKVELTVAGNDGSALIKTGDTLVVTIYDGETVVAQVRYTAVVAGDVNRDGRITASDAVAMMTIFNGKSGSFTESQITAADSNKDGRITASDAVRIMTKYMDWDAYRTQLSGKK